MRFSGCYAGFNGGLRGFDVVAFQTERRRASGPITKRLPGANHDIVHWRDKIADGILWVTGNWK